MTQPTDKPDDGLTVSQEDKPAATLLREDIERCLNLADQDADYQVGYFREKLEQLEREHEAFKDKAIAFRLAATPERQPTDTAAQLAEAWELAKVNNDLARHETNGRRQLQAENARLKEALEVFQGFGCPVCSGDCASANPPVIACPMDMANAALTPKGPE